MFMRNENNPLITKKDVRPSRKGLEVIGVFNAGAVQVDGETILLVRVAEKAEQDGNGILCPVFNWEDALIHTLRFPDDGVIDYSDSRQFYVDGKLYLTSISHLRVARSNDGVHFEVSNRPFLAPADEYEAFGVEDARITRIEDTYYITYTAASPYGIVVRLAETKDFITAERRTILFPPDNKDAVLFPEQVNGRYACLHRPSASNFARPEIWFAWSNDLQSFGDHRFVAGVRPGKWDCGRIGAGAPPILTDKGWLEIYHGADMDNNYHMGAMLLDRAEPWKVLARSGVPLLSPEAPYEKNGFFSNVVFSCGVVHSGSQIHMYYGAADESIASAVITLDQIFDHLKQF